MSTPLPNLDGLKCIVIGGSLGGLSAALSLLQHGADVQIYERAIGTLQDRGAGLGVDPTLVNRFLPPASVSERELVSIHMTGRHLVSSWGEFQEPGSFFVTSYDVLYGCLRKAFPDDRYHQAATLVSIQQDGGDDPVQVGFADGSSATCQLLVGADGYQSTIRQLLLPPDIPKQATYAGYVLWRGFLEEGELDAEIHDYFFRDVNHIVSLPPYHLVVYQVPGKGGSVTPGQRRLNWGWYFRAPETQVHQEFLHDRWGIQHHFSLAPGQSSSQTTQYLRSIAKTVWPEQCQRLIETTIEGDHLFLQMIYEYMPTRMVAGRACLLGDAAHVASPITGSGARFAMLDALALSTALQASTTMGKIDVARALQDYERQQLVLAQRLVASGRRWGADFG